MEAGTTLGVSGRSWSLKEVRPLQETPPKTVGEERNAPSSPAPSPPISYQLAAPNKYWAEHGQGEEWIFR